MITVAVFLAFFAFCDYNHTPSSPQQAGIVILMFVISLIVEHAWIEAAKSRRDNNA